MAEEVDHLRDQKLFFKLYLAQDCTLILVGLTDMVYDNTCAVCGEQKGHITVFSHQYAYLVGSSVSVKPPTMLTTFFLFSKPP